VSYIFVSDLHIKPASSYRKTLLTGDAFYALDQIQEYALEHKVTAMILGGDVYDSNQPPGESINRMAEFIRVLNDAKVMVYYIEGNHDRVHRNPYLPEEYYSEHRLLSSIGAKPLTSCSIDGAVFRGIDYCQGDKLKEQLEVLEECDVLCLHTGFRHLLGFEDAYDITKEDIPEAVKRMVLVGHIHVQNSSTTAKGVAVHSSGSTWVWRVDEADKEHGFLHFGTGDPFTPTFVPLDVRRYFDIDCEQDIIDTMEECHALPPVLRYSRDVLPALDHSDYPRVRLIAMSGDKDVEEALDAAEEYAADLLEALIIAVPPDVFPDLYALLKALLESQDPAEFLQQYLIEKDVTLKETV